jgi:hypothetical protein
VAHGHHSWGKLSQAKNTLAGLAYSPETEFALNECSTEFIQANGTPTTAPITLIIRQAN